MAATWKEFVPPSIIMLIMVMYLLSCPYTKVEESFNMQAIHDILHHATNLSKYDHHEFPGVVPRSFIGPLFISGLSLPSLSFLSMFNLEKFMDQYVVRFWIGCSSFFGMCQYAAALQKMFGPKVKLYFVVITLTQFHYLFYITRPLPNTLAHIFAFPAMAAWLRNDISKFIWFSAIAIVIFRIELCILLGTCLIISILKGYASIKQILKEAIPAGIFALLATIVIDSLMWKRWLWPEGDVAWFNIILNKSGEYGTSPFLWYFTSVLPRVLLTASIFLPWGLRCDVHRCSVFMFPAIAFVLAFSFLPHKELRFIYYTIPLFNAVAARAYSDLHQRHSKHVKWKLLYIFGLLCLVANIAASLFFLYASCHNYPGGEIMSKLHQHVPCDKKVHVYISNYAAQTGVTRFTEACANWKYNKTEHLSDNELQLDLSFTHLILEYNKVDMALWMKTHKHIDSSSVFSHFVIQKNPLFFNLLFPSLKTKPALLLLQRQTFS